MRSAAIIRMGENVAMIERIRAGRTYYLFPEGEFGTGDGEELNSKVDSPRGSYRSVRIQLDQFLLLDVRPKSLATALCRCKLHPWSGCLMLQEQEVEENVADGRHTQNMESR